MSSRPRRLAAGAALLAALLAIGACSTGGDDSPATSTAADSATASTDPSTCGYLYEWATTWRLPLQPDPHAAYTYVVSRVTPGVGFEVTGDLPYAAWTSWMVYTGFTAGTSPFSVVKDGDITPDDGSVNPFVPGTAVMSPNRGFRLLVVPKGTDTTTLPARLADVPASNVLTSPTTGNAFILANRVYNAFPGYNQGGAAGPTDTRFPQVRAVDLTTGQGVDCSTLNLVPDPKPPTDMPTGSATADSTLVKLLDGTSFGAGVGGGRSSGTGAEYAPALDPDYVEFTRPPLLPGADVSELPPPDNCAGYLGAITSTTEISLIRIPKVATWFDTTNLTDSSPFVQEEATYISLTQYGASTASYEPGKPDTGSLGNAELLPDSSGGSTVVVWPRSLTADQQQQVVAYATTQGWALMRGGEQGDVTTANLFLRMKGTSPSYQGGFTPTSDRSGVPCYFDDHPSSTSWADVTGDEYVASAENIGAAAPQGVNCSLDDFLGGQCLSDLKRRISSTGGSYGG